MKRPRTTSPATATPASGGGHATVPVDDVMAAAWMRCMRTALDRCNVTGDVRDFLETRLSEVALFLRNQG